MEVNIKFEIQSGEEIDIKTKEGMSILEIVKEYNVDLECACEGSLACSTCHLILDEETYNKLPQPEEAEEDMLDLAFALTKTSRLGCQIIITSELEGARFKIPA